MSIFSWFFLVCGILLYFNVGALVLGALGGLDVKSKKEFFITCITFFFWPFFWAVRMAVNFYDWWSNLKDE